MFDITINMILNLMGTGSTVAGFGNECANPKRLVGKLAVDPKATRNGDTGGGAGT